MNENFNRKEQCDVQKRHYKWRNGFGESIEWIADDEKPVEEVRVTFGYAVIHIIPDERPNCHTRNDSQISVTFFDINLIALISKRQYSVNGHNAVEYQCLHDAVAKRMHRVPHYAGGIDEVNQVGYQSKHYE